MKFSRQTIAAKYAYVLRDRGIKVNYENHAGTYVYSLFDGPFIEKSKVAQYLRDNHGIELGRAN